MYSMQSTGGGFVDKAVGFNTDLFKFRPKALPLFAARVKVQLDPLRVVLLGGKKYLIVELVWKAS